MRENGRMDRLALVTGAAQGIGAAVAVALAEAGNRVIAADLNLAGTQSMVARLPGSGHPAVEMDVTAEASIQKVFADTEAAIGPIAILVCVAGGPVGHTGEKRRIATTSVDEWIKTEALNARSTFMCIREYLRYREARRVSDGRIITLSSLAGLGPGSPPGPAYSAAKAAIIGLTRCAALEAAEFGVTANTIAPGLIETPGVRAEMTAEQVAAVARITPAGRLGRPEDIASVIRFLTSPEAGFMTGCTVEVNGGRHMA